MSTPNSDKERSIGSVSIDFLCGSIDTDPIDILADAEYETPELVRLSEHLLAGMPAEWRFALQCAGEMICGKLSVVLYLQTRVLFHIQARQPDWS